MTLVVEAGMGANPAANCYISTASADAYFADRGITAWTGATAVKEAAIIRATDYLEWAYTWKGVRLSELQPLQWPRTFYPNDVVNRLINLNIVPPVVVNANAELALLALSGTLMPETVGQKLMSESVSVGGAISRSRSFAGGGGFSNQRRFPFVDRMLGRYASGGSMGVRSSNIERA